MKKKYDLGLKSEFKIIKRKGRFYVIPRKSKP